MSDSQPASANRAVFLSYASQDAEAVLRIAEALRASGVEVWFDKDELVGGDAWDAKIRGQIGSCALFLPVVSAATQARLEGYFRLEWKLAAQRTHTMAEEKPFLLPVVIDATRDADAKVPSEFRAVQWTRLPGGETSAAFCGQVKRLLSASRNAAAQAAPASSRLAAEMAGETPALPPPARRRRWLWPVTVAGLVGVAIAFYVSYRPPTPGSAAAPSIFDPKSIVVLPFANLSADKNNEFFSDGLSDNIRDKLAAQPVLRLMARTTSFAYKGRNVPAAQIAQELRVGTIIEGSVQREGQHVRVTAQRINAADGTQAWSQTFDADLSTEKIFALQDKIALAIAAQLAPQAAPAAAAPRPTAILAAYDAFLRGRSMEARQLGGRSRRLAIPFYEEAVRLDPGFALGWAHLAHALAWVHWGSGEITGDEFERAQRALAEATRLRPDLAEVHLARAALLKSDGVNLREAARELALAEQLKPNDPEIAFEQALVARFSGRLEEALAFCRRSIERDPQNPNVYNTQGLVLNFLGRYPEALAAFDQAIALSYDTGPRANRAHAILRAEGDAAKALREYALIPEERLDLQWRVFLTEMQLAGGSQAAALAGIARIEQPAALSQWAFYVRPLLAARVKEMMGDAEGAHRDYTEALPMALAYRDRHPRSWRAYPAVAQAFAGLGRKEEALAAAREALKLVPPAENPYYAQLITLPVLVEMQARFGLADEALAIVREQIAAGWWRRHDLLLRPEFFFIRKDPRFRELAEQAPL